MTIDKQYITDYSVAIAIITILYLLILPLTTIWIRRIWLRRTSLIMQKRYIYASLICCSFLSIVLFIERPAALFIHVYKSEHQYDLSYRILSCVQLSLRVYGLQAFVYCLFYRFWMVYFEFIYAKSLQHEQWKIQINPRGCSKQEQWILDHRKDYGNPFWARKLMFLIWFSCSSTSSIMYFLAEFMHFDWNTYNSLLYVAPLIANIIIWLKFPPFLDSIFVRYELKAIIIAYIVVFLIKVSCDVTIRLTPISEFYTSVLWTGHTLIVCVTGIFLQTQYVLYKVQRRQHFRNLLKVRPKFLKMKTSTQPDDAPKLKYVTSMSFSASAQKYRLCDVLQDHDAFNLFVQHLSTELSTECMFSFIEFTQFKSLIEDDEVVMKRINEYIPAPNDIGMQLKNNRLMPSSPKLLMKTNPSRYDFDRLILLDEDTIPLSHIVHIKYEDELVNVQRYKCIVKSLVAKYVLNSADLCINIAYGARANIIKWTRMHCDNEEELRGDQLNQMYCLFDNCRKEMYYLMKHTMSRFIDKHKFTINAPMFIDKEQPITP